MDFALIMFIGLIITGFVALWDRIVGTPKRRRTIQRLKEAGESDQAILEKAIKPALLVEYAKAFFPVILIVFLLRSFVVEPFRIPSGSMLPSLFIGDFILVNKFKYGLRLPLLNVKFLDIAEPRRGDVMVFRYPHDSSINYIKRVVGLPGDHIVYKDKRLYINNRLIQNSDGASYQFEETGKRQVEARRLVENMDGQSHDIIVDEKKRQARMEFSVPAGHYFVMGDNRDYSNDSRYWGYVPNRLVVGKAFLIWFNWDVVNGGHVNWQRIGMFIH